MADTDRATYLDDLDAKLESIDKGVAEVLIVVAEISARVIAFEELLEHYRPALEIVEQRVNRAQRFQRKGRRDGHEG